MPNPPGPFAAPFDAPLAIARDLINALPDYVAIYLAASDLVIPNERWRQEIGPTTRLADLAWLSIDVDAARARIAQGHDGYPRGDELDCVMPGDGPFSGPCRLRVSSLAQHPGAYCLVLKDESALRRVEQMRKDFIANVSHELRTPLTAVKGYVETLLDPAFLTVARVQEFLPVIFEHTERLHNLMLDLLSLSRLESADTRIELSPLSLADELQEAIDATAPLSAMKNIGIDLRLPPHELRVLANPEHMERILVNLLDNAIKYSSPGGRVWIWTEAEGGFAWTHVRDEGTGIAPEDLSRVFERFYRTKGALNGRQRGSGLGLAIVKHIVQQLGGDIRVTSHVGQGSHFSFSLRMAESSQAGVANS